MPNAVAALIAAAALAGCATLACRPDTIVVASKAQRTRLVTETRGLRISPRGHLDEDIRIVPTREHWVQADSGEWFPVPESAWLSAEPGQPLQVCR